jgi:hypothetical protein
MGTHRRELPRGRSWPISVSQVEEALANLGAPLPSRIRRFVGAAKGKTYFTLSWNPQRSHWAKPWSAGDEYVSVTFTSVASDHRAEVRDIYVGTVLPDLAAWLCRASEAPEGWRILRHERHWNWSEGDLEVSGDNPP